MTILVKTESAGYGFNATSFDLDEINDVFTVFYWTEHEFRRIGIDKSEFALDELHCITLDGYVLWQKEENT